MNQQAQTTIIQGEGSKDEPYTLEDDTAAEDDDVLENAAVEILQSDGQPSNQVPRHQTTDQRPPDLQPDTELRAYEKHTSSTTAELDDKDAEDAEASEDQPQDMYCLLCKTLVPASDVPGHRTSILHQLSKSSTKDKAPLVPPTHYGVRSSNIGYGMLQRLGWVEDTGLGSSTLGRKTPLKASDKHDRKGLGVDSKKRHQEEQLEKEGKVVKKSRVQTQQSQAAAKPLAKNRKELERAKKREMQMFKEGLAYLNT